MFQSESHEELFKLVSTNIVCPPLERWLKENPDIETPRELWAKIDRGDWLVCLMPFLGFSKEQVITAVCATLPTNIQGAPQYLNESVYTLLIQLGTTGATDKTALSRIAYDLLTVGARIIGYAAQRQDERSSFSPEFTAFYAGFYACNDAIKTSSITTKSLFVV